MDGLAIFTTLMAMNNRTTEAFKMVLRDKTPLGDDWRRIATLAFSVLFGIFLVGGAIFSGSVSFEGTWLEAFMVNPFIAAIVGGASISMVSGIVQPLIDRLQSESKAPTGGSETTTLDFEVQSSSHTEHAQAA